MWAKFEQWLACRFGFHNKTNIEFHHCDDMKVHQLQRCEWCEALFAEDI